MEEEGESQQKRKKEESRWSMERAEQEDEKANGYTDVFLR